MPLTIGCRGTKGAVRWSVPFGSARLRRVARMFKVAVLVWILIGVVGAGIALTVVLAVPSLSANAMKLLPIVSLAGFVVTIPISFVIAKMILAQTKGA